MTESEFEKKARVGITFKTLGVGIILLITIPSLTFCVFYWYKFGRLPWQKEVGESEEVADSTLEEIDAQLQSIPDATEVEKIARVGEEYLFITDLDYYAYLTTGAYEVEDRDAAIEELIDESVLLQAGEGEGWIELTSEVLNNPFKDFEKRSSLIVDVEEKFEYYKKEQTIIEQVAVFIWNVELGELAKSQGLDAAKSFAKEKIDNVYTLVAEEGKTMEEAGEILANDASLAQLDESYQGNAYGEALLSDEDDLGPEDSDFGVFVRNAQEGEISPIYLETAKDASGEEFDVRYVFYNLKTRQTGFQVISEWIENFSQSLNIQIYSSEE